jgi:hypothetical protein
MDSKQEGDLTERRQAPEQSLCWSRWLVGDFGCCQREDAENTRIIPRISAPEGLQPTARRFADSGLAMQDAAALNYRKAAEEKLNCISRFESRDKGTVKSQRGSAQAYSRQGQTSISPEARRSRTSASPEAGRHKAAGAPPAGTRTSVSPHRHHLHHSEISDHKSRGHVPAWEPALKQINVVQHAARPHIQREG